MNYKQQHDKLSNFILSWVDAVYDTDEKKSRFYTYLGLMIQSRLMSDLVNVDDEYAGYQVAGTQPLMDRMNGYDIDEVYNEWLKQEVIA